LDYSFDVLISQIDNLGLYNGFSIFTSFETSLPAPVYLCLQYDFQYMLFDSDLSMHVCLSMRATWHSSHHLLGSFWLSWSACSDLRVWTL